MKKLIKKHALTVVVAIMVVLLILLFFAPKIIITIESGQAGVLFRRIGNGTEIDRYYSEGITLILPWNKMYIYDVRMQEQHATLDVLTKDGLMVTTEVSARFSANVKTIGVLHKFIGPNYVEKVVMPEVEAEVRNIVSQYDLDELYTQDRRVIQRLITDSILDDINDQVIVDKILLTEGKSNTYIIFQDLFIKSIRLPKPVARTIERKIEAEHEYLTYQYLLLSAQQESKRKEIEAQGIAAFQDISRISILKWRGLEVTEKLSHSPNSKIIVMGTDNNLPILLNGEVSPDTLRRKP